MPRKRDKYNQLEIFNPGEPSYESVPFKYSSDQNTVTTGIPHRSGIHIVQTCLIVRFLNSGL